MQAEQVDALIEETAIIAVMRGAFGPDTALELVDTLLESGISVFEFTMNSDDPIGALKAAKAEFGEEACIGMGTVLTVDDANAVMDAGADFVVSPAFQPEVVQAVLARDVLMVPGVITPSEALQASALGVKALKLFPIGPLSVDYFKAISGALSHMRFMCNGAINDKNAGEFVRAGAIAVGAAGWLTGDGSWPLNRIRSRARILQNSIAVARGGQAFEPYEDI